jgi:hypothetical protein
MPAIFFKRFWETVGGRVQEEVLNVLKGGEIPEGWNETTVVLTQSNRSPTFERPAANQSLQCAV